MNFKQELSPAKWSLYSTLFVIFCLTPSLPALLDFPWLTYFRNVHKWRPIHVFRPFFTYVGTYLPTYHVRRFLPNIYHPVFGDFLGPPTYPKIWRHLWVPPLYFCPYVLESDMAFCWFLSFSTLVELGTFWPNQCESILP